MDEQSAKASQSGDGAALASSGCTVCRSRKVRCDRALPTCQNCLRLGVRCPGYEGNRKGMSRRKMLESMHDIYKAAGVEKRKIGSCDQCRASKDRCTKSKPSCERCSLRGLDCSYLGKDARNSESPGQSAIGQPGTLLNGIRLSGTPITMDQLCGDTIPEDPSLRSILVHTYFERVHPLRYSSFLHKPSFLVAMDQGSIIEDYGEPLLYVICALGARVLFLDHLHSLSSPTKPLHAAPGDAWANKARTSVMAVAHIPTLENLMVMILLCHYGLKTDQHSMVFVLGGCLYRGMRLLDLDSARSNPQRESTTDVISREIEIRVVWACYIIDSLAASGVDKNSSWRSDIPLIPLPSANHEFLSQSSPLHLRHLADFDRPGMLSNVTNLDLPALGVVMTELRSHVLRLIRTSPLLTIGIHESSSPFMVLIDKLDVFWKHMPERFRLTDLNIYVHRDQHILGAVFNIHFLYHAAIFDLTRISLAGFNFPLAASFGTAPPKFRLQCQDRCRFHAVEVSNMIRLGSKGGPGAFDDVFCADAAFESSKVQIVYCATVASDEETATSTRQNLRTNLQLLKRMHAGKEGGSPHINAILSLCTAFGFRDIVDEWCDHHESSNVTAEVTGSSDIDHLGNLSAFRRARGEVRAQQSSASPQTAQSSDGHFSLNARRKVPVIEPSNDMHDSMAQAPQTYGNSSANDTLPDLRSGGQGAQQAAPDISGTDYNILNPVGVDQLSIDHYIRTAEEMTECLTWGSSELTEMGNWVDFNYP